MRYSLVLVGCLVAHLAIATFEFESKDSTLKISSTASLYLDNSTLMSGTLQKVSSSSEISLGGNSATYGPGYIVAGASATATVGDFNLSSSGELERNSDIEASDKITVSDDMTLDGKGGRISFSNPDTAQLVVNSNKTLTLQNITLSRIGTNTISLAETAKIVIGSNVSFELIDDVTLTQGVIELSGTAVVFKIKGLGGRKHFKLEPDVYHQTDKLLRLGAHTVLLDAIEFSGIRYMTATTTSRTVVGDITLAGTTILNIDYAAITISITAQSRDNVIKISKNNVNLDCFFFFGTAEENEVHFQFSGISGIPAIRFGTNFMALSTTAGRAKLMFDDPEVNIYNKGAESFTIGSNAYFDGHKITIQNYPIKQTAANFDSSSNLELESVLTNAISRIVTRAPFDHSLMNRPTTAFLIKQREQFGDAPFQKEIPKPDGKKKDGVHGNRPAGVTPRPRVPRRAPEDLSFEDIEGVYYDLCDFELPEGAFKTIAATATSEYQYAMKMGSASGLISLKKTGKLTGFGINASDQLLLTMNNGSKIEQSTTAATFKSNDTLTVNGTGNIIDVSANMTLSGTLSLQASSDLTFNFKDVATPPVLTIGSSSGVSLPAGSTLIFNGKGTVKILDGVDFTFVETSVLEMSDSAKLTLDTSATSTFSGKGTIKLSDGGLLALESAGHLTLGTATTDELNIKAVRSGVLSAEAASGTAWISFNTGTFTFDVSQGGLIMAGAGGDIEFNSMTGVPTYGVVSSCSLTPDGVMLVDSGGKISFCEGRASSLAASLSNIDWNSTGARIRGRGTVKFVDRVSTTDFEGKVSALNDVAYFKSSSTTMEAVVEALVQRDSTLGYSTFFKNSAGTNVVRTSQGVLVTLSSTSSMVSDDANGNFTSFDSATNLYSRYNTSGSRI